MDQLKLKFILFMVAQVLRSSIKKNEVVRKHVGDKHAVVQVKLRDGSIGHWYDVSIDGVKSKGGLHPKPDVTVDFLDLETALTFLHPNADRGEIIHAMKNFRVLLIGDDALAVWFSQLVSLTANAKLEYGKKMPDGSVRYTSASNGGPMFVYVKDGKILRITPIDLDETDAPSFVIRARGKTFSPDRRVSFNPHAQSLKSIVYSDKRILYPMKRVDFDPNGARNPQNRGKSGYVRISWDEAFDLVANEIKRQRQVYGPGALAIWHGSHHQWGNVGYYLSALLRFGNLIGFTRVHHNPDSWEGWYWGAIHHYGNSARVGISGPYGLVEDCLKEAEMIVFWSSDPESSNVPYGCYEGTKRRMWAKDLGIEMVHIDPNFNPTAQLFGGRWIPIKPGTDPALAIAIMNVWMNEGLYDKDYVANRTTGFEEWRDYVLGNTDGVPKTPEWQEEETGVPAHVVRALARKWGNRKVYLSPGGTGVGFGGACRNATGTQFARNLVMMMAMQGLGKPGVNFGNLQFGTPMNNYFWFPGYAEGGISGELQWTGAAPHTYCRMPHILSVNPIKQMVPRQRLPDAIIDGRAKGYLWDGFSNEAQFQAYEYPEPGYSKIHMIYRYGSSTFGTLAKSGRYIDMFRHESIDMVVSQTIWMEGDAHFADVILPACTSFERWDIGEVSNAGGYVHHCTHSLNHRVVVMQHKCIEPLGESKSDYAIFTGILNRMGTGALFTEGCSELDWAKRMFMASDVSKRMKWADFVKKGYYVVPPEPENIRTPRNYGWFAEGRVKDAPEPFPLPSQWAGDFGKGLSTQSGKFEFIPNSLKRFDAVDPERNPLNRYLPSWEGPRTEAVVKRFPVQMISTHSRYSFHTYGDGKDSTINDIEGHRVNVGGYYYWVMRINDGDAKARGIKHHDLIRVFNDRGSVVCAADVSPFMAPGVCKAYESSAEADFHHDPRFGLVDFGGCVNILTPDRPQIRNSDGMGSNACLVQFETWVPAEQNLMRA